MASTITSLRATALRMTSRIWPRRLAVPSSSNASIHTKTHHFKVAAPSFASTLGPSDRAFYDSLSPDERKEYEETESALERHMKSPEVERRLNNSVAAAIRRLPNDEPAYGDERFKPVKPGLISMGEGDDVGPDEVFQGDDMSSIAHGELQQHRELREYARIAAWEMPLLSKLSKPFELPPTTHPLRFRHTTYFGETHPAEQKVVLEFTTADLPLTPSQRHCLIKLVGIRYNPQTDVVRLSCEMFETSAQNKRYLGDLVDTLMRESKEREEEFTDIPVDFRHVKWKTKEVFPDSWRLTEKRREELQARRKERQERETKLIESGALVDGVGLIEAAVRQAPIQELIKVDMERGVVRGSGSGRASSGSGKSGSRKVERKRVF